MLPRNKEEDQRFLAALEAKSCENRNNFMKNPPLVCDEQPRNLVFSSSTDFYDIEKSLNKIKQSISKDINKALKPIKIKVKMPKMSKKERKECIRKGEIWKLPIFQKIGLEAEIYLNNEGKYSYANVIYMP